MAETIRKTKFLIKSFILSLVSFAQARIFYVYEKWGPQKPERDSGSMRIVIVQLGQIGDLVLSEPIFFWLKKYYGSRLHLAVMVNSGNKAICENNSFVDDVIVYNSSKYSRGKIGRENFPENLFKGKDYFDLAVWLRGDWHVLCRIFRNMVPCVSMTKYPNPLRWAWMPLITKRSVYKKCKHYSQYLGDLMEDIVGEECSPNDNDVSVSVDSRRDKIFIHISSGGDLRQWPKTSFSKLCRMILASYNSVSIYFIGAAEDASIAENILESEELKIYLDRITNYCGNVPLCDLGVFLKTGLLYIGVDSGPMHIAAAGGVPIVALFGPQSPELFGPLGQQKRAIVYNRHYCSPCWQFACWQNKTGAGACILSISSREVFEEVKNILEGEVFQSEC